jgi:ribosomal protein L31
LSYDDNDDCGESIEPRSRLEQRTPNKIKLYPNPASNTLSLTKSYPGTVKIVIRNIKGATLIETTTEADNLELDVSSLESGVYTVKTEFADKTIEIDKLVIL